MTSARVERSVLSREFYERPTLDVARDLLGKVFVRRIDNISLKGRIVEVEAYIGEDDPACHARFGQTNRNRVMYGRGGVAYIYFIYGMYDMLNYVTEPEGNAAAVLIRGIEPVEGIETMMQLRNCDNIANLTNGPGKICQAFSLDTSHSGTDLTGGEMLVTEGDDSGFEIATSSRIGIKNGTDRQWRFYIKGNAFVSRL